VSFYDWLLALHVLSAFAIGASLVLFSVLVFTGRQTRSLEETLPLFRLGAVGSILVGVGSTLAFVLGVVLAIDSDDYQLWDGWVIAAIVLFALMGAVGQRTGTYYTNIQKLAESGGKEVETEVFQRLRAPTGRLLHLGTAVLFVLVLVVMIFKPGA
jgi:hypothetical protein